ncbi:MAG: nuclear transport factor 2 family protein [Verrucomicrobia bacterium]|nr:nuclear transport factor 2 family protein [Verrucomicrobiota bacterium]
MKSLLRLLSLCAVLGLPLSGAEQNKLIAAVRAADDERIAATTSASRARLEAVYSDALHYAHSSGRVDTKASQIELILTSGNKYERIEHKERTFIPAGPGIVLMKGRALYHMAGSGGRVVNDLNYLAVWREEGGQWRFLAWQSCKNPPPDAKK